MWSKLSAREQRSSGVDLTSLKRSERVEVVRRMSVNRHLTSNHVRGIKSMDRDTVEKRYVLTGAFDSCISIFDQQSSSLKPLASTYSPNTRLGIQCAKWYTTDTGLFFTAPVGSRIDTWDTNRMIITASVSFAPLVSDIALSPLGHHALIAVACDDGIIRLCDIRTQNASHELRGHRDCVLSVSWSPIEEHVFASGSTDATVQVWDIRRPTSKLVCDMHNQTQSINRRKRGAVFQQDPSSHHIQSHQTAVTGIRYTCDGLRILSHATDGSIYGWDAFNGNRQFYMTRDGQFDGGADISLDPDEILFLPHRRRIVVIDFKTGETISMLEGHFGNVWSTALMDDGALWTADSVGRIMEWT